MLDKSKNTRFSPNGISWNEYTTDQKLAFLPSVYYVIQVLNNVIKTSLSIDSQAWSLLSYFFMCVLAAIMLWTILDMLNRIGGTFVIVELATTLLFLESLVLGYSSEALLVERGYWVFFVSIPIAFYCLAIKDKDSLYSRLLKASYVVIILDCFASFRLAQESSYNMSLTMTSLPLIFIQVREAMRSRKTLNVVFSVLGVLFIIIFGNRGAVACLLFFLISFFAFFMELDLKKLTIIAVAFIGVYLLVSNADLAINAINNIFGRMGFNTYIIRRLMQGTFFESSARDDLYSHYTDLVVHAPWYGYGLYGNWISGGLGPHNSLLTLFLAFGIVPGGLLGLLFVSLFLKAVFIVRIGDSAADLVFCFAAACFSELLTAGFNITSPTLTIFLCLCVAHQGQKAAFNTGMLQKRNAPIAVSHPKTDDDAATTPSLNAM